MRAVNLALRFLLELCLLAAFAYCAAGATGSTAANVVLAIGVPLAVGVVWGLFVAPRASRPLSTVPWVGLQIVLFGLGGLGLASRGEQTLGAILFVVAIANLAILVALGEPGRSRENVTKL
ncbi:MAG TPA: YrdB family protein [Gaiellaceae bacterium]|nr:YrdB family protein [Gaiellaceae bacterium]